MVKTEKFVILSSRLCVGHKVFLKDQIVYESDFKNYVPINVLVLKGFLRRVD